PVFVLIVRSPPLATLFPYTTLFRSIGLANAGGDTTNSIKQAAEFGIVKGGQNLAGLLVFLTDIHALGLPTAQGLILTNTFYWDQDRKSTRLNSSHLVISYAVFCLKK